MGELRHSNVNTFNDWTNNANSSVFDFACYYKMNDAFDGDNPAVFNDDIMCKRNPCKAITFVKNHDTNEIWKERIGLFLCFTLIRVSAIFLRKLPRMVK